MLRPATLLLLCVFCTCVRAQHHAGKPTLEAIRTETGPKVDGVLDEDAWKKATPAENFTTLRPNPGLPSRQRSDVRVVYDNGGIYVGARLYDGSPDSILTELTERDDIGNSDFFGVTIDAYQSGINGFNFVVSAAGVQFDAQQTAEGEDGNWDAVWVSKTTRDAEGWVAEIFIPYSALRFPAKPEQTWTINFVRMIRRTNEQSFWAEIDPNVDGFFNQSGTLTGLYNVKSPVRIQATPFLAGYLLNGRQPGVHTTTGTSVTGGMDVKVGLSDAFTLDMTLVPDFGEARSDDQILNLGPFEQRFDEQRAFFTEGTELFNKGDLFYSRRVGGGNHFGGAVAAATGEDDEVVDNPQRAKLYNATKISGRTAGGLGLGFFNAVEQENTAILRSGEGTEREVRTNPLTNYNVFVADQNLPNNSTVTLVNTNVLREGEARDANVTGLLFDLHDTANKYAVRGAFKHSRIYEGERTTGHAANLEVARISGAWTWQLGYGEESDTYDPNDLGILFANNSRSVFTRIRYNERNPFWGGRFVNGGGGLFVGYQRLYAPSRYTGASAESWIYGQTKGFWNLELWTDHQLGEQVDYFEPRVAGRYWTVAGSSGIGGWMGTDDRKKLRLSANFNYDAWRGDSRTSFSHNFNARYRFSDRFSLQGFVWRGSYRDEVGYVNRQASAVFMGRRDRNAVETGLFGKYSFGPNMTLNLRVRHYWSGVAYGSFHLLAGDGTLTDTDYTDNHDQDFDAFNVDLMYRWRFAPGSDLFLTYKTNVTDFDRERAATYGDSFRGLWGDTNRQGSLSMKVVYWLDYASLVN